MAGRSAEGGVAMSLFGMKSREELGDHLRTIARIVARCRAERAAEDRKAASRRRDPSQISIGQIMWLVAPWALCFATWRRPSPVS
jgi:hypothetical protein